MAFSRILDEAELLKIAVQKDYRGEKLGKELLNYFISYLKSEKIEKIYLEVRKSNNIAKNLYEKSGFKKIYERKNYYEDSEDAEVMCLDVNEYKMS